MTKIPWSTNSSHHRAQSRGHKGNNKMEINPNKETLTCLSEQKETGRTRVLPWWTAWFWQWFKNCQRTCKLRWKLFFLLLKNQVHHQTPFYGVAYSYNFIYVSPLYRLLFSYKINVQVVRICTKSIMAQTLSNVCYFTPAVAGCPTSEIISGNL